MSKLLWIAGLSAGLLPLAAHASLVVSNGVILPANATYNDPGSTGYTNASSIVPGAGNVAAGSTVLSTNYVGNNEANGGLVTVLVDNRTAANPSNAGNASVNPSEGTSPLNSTFDLGGGPQPWYGAFTLPAAGASDGYDITSAQVISGHQDSRVNQAYDLLVSSDGVNFFSLFDNSSHTLPAAGAGASASAGFSYNPSNGHGGGAQSTVTPATGALLATGVKYFEFVDLSSGNDIYREVAFYGTPTAVPEPATIGMLSIAGVSLLARRRRRAAR